MSSNRRAGFTLVELMVVIVIIGLLSGAVTIGVRSYLISGKQSVAKMEISKIQTALDTFYSVYSRYPTSEEGIRVLTEKSEKIPDSLLSKLPVDPWGNEYEYLQPGRTGPFEIICYEWSDIMSTLFIVKSKALIIYIFYSNHFIFDSKLRI